MKAGAAKSRPEWGSRRETNKGRQMKAGAAKSRPGWRSCRETNEGRHMKAGAAKSRPEWRSQRETNEGRRGGSGSDFGDQQPNITPNSFQRMKTNEEAGILGISMQGDK